MRNKIIITILSICLFISVGVNIYQNNKVKVEKKLYEDSYSKVYSKLTALNYDSFEKMVNSSEEFYVYIGRPNCGDCKDMEGYFLDLIDEYNLQTKLYYFNTKELSKNKSEWNEFKEKYDIEYTPTLAKFQNGKLVNKSEWTPETGYSKSQVQKWLSENNLNN